MGVDAVEVSLAVVHLYLGLLNQLDWNVGARIEGAFPEEELYLVDVAWYEIRVKRRGSERICMDLSPESLPPGINSGWEPLGELTNPWAQLTRTMQQKRTSFLKVCAADLLLAVLDVGSPATKWTLTMAGPAT
ncbi:unnamed protein product [Cyclocybe aegerita]|uniref:Uncharacterized protein n=1 Tax=Cyclocybe aegerita TaxID=1973307 RepID=A0A8S0W4M6_CYCAE|nr:unnamed protein product [Cyclocybe aegerita]